MALSLEDAIAKVKHYFAHEWKGGKLHINGIIRMVDNHNGVARRVMEALGATPEFIYENNPICPEGHDCEPDGYCDECGLTYSSNQVEAMRYLYPSLESGIKPKIITDSEAAKYVAAVHSIVPCLAGQEAYAIAEAVIKASRE